MKVIIEKKGQREYPFRVYALRGMPPTNPLIARMNIAPPREVKTKEEALEIARELLEGSQENISSQTKEI